MTAALCLLSFIGGMAVAWTAARHALREARREINDLRAFVMTRRRIELSPEDSIRQAGC